MEKGNFYFYFVTNSVEKQPNGNKQTIKQTNSNNPEKLTIEQIYSPLL